MKPFQNIKVRYALEITTSEGRAPVTYSTSETITGPVFDPKFTLAKMAREMTKPQERAQSFVYSFLDSDGQSG